MWRVKRTSVLCMSGLYWTFFVGQNKKEPRGIFSSIYSSSTWVVKSKSIFAFRLMFECIVLLIWQGWAVDVILDSFKTEKFRLVYYIFNIFLSPFQFFSTLFFRSTWWDYKLADSIGLDTTLGQSVSVSKLRWVVDSRDARWKAEKIGSLISDFNG